MIYLVINKFGYCMGTSEVSVRHIGRHLHSRCPKVIRCYSIDDAKTLINAYIATSGLRIHEPVFKIGDAVFFQPVETRVILNLEKQIKTTISNDGLITIVNLSDQTEIDRFSVDPGSFVPDVHGKEMILRNGAIPYWDFDLDRKAKIILNGTRYTLEVS